VSTFRSEEGSFGGSVRCLIPADGFFEFTGAETGQKRQDERVLLPPGAPLFWIAGLIRDDAFAMLTIALDRISRPTTIGRSS
jgi:putative SOS response-associated peptidase YedK